MVGVRLAEVRERIASAGGDADTITVMAVTKGFGPDAVRAAFANGLHVVGENYAQELLGKAEALAADPGAGALSWHYLGAIQRNKVRALAAVVDCFESVARRVEGEAIARHHPGARVMVEVDVSDVAGRNGCSEDDAGALVAELRDLGLDVVGLMTVAPQGPGARAAFRSVRRLADGLGLPERSMGMSDDLEAAVAEGSTSVRIGRGLFGDRPPRTARTGR